MLFLDEPTNHLDIAAEEWLEGYLSQWKGAALIVSHDRYFLDRVCNGILDMTRAGLEHYPGNYTAYLQERQLRADHRQESFEAEKEKLLKDVEYIKKEHLRSKCQPGKRQITPAEPHRASHRTGWLSSGDEPEMG